MIKIGNEEWQHYPTLFQKRWTHSCGTLEINGRPALIVTGGFNFRDKTLKTTEILDFSVGYWKRGPDLPQPIMQATMLSSPQNDALYLLGGIVDYDVYFQKVLKLTCLGDIDSCTWSEMPQKLAYPRASHVAMLVPKNITFCSPKNDD